MGKKDNFAVAGFKGKVINDHAVFPEHVQNPHQKPGRKLQRIPKDTARYLIFSAHFLAQFSFFPEFFLVRPCLKNFNRDHRVLVGEATIG